MFQYSDLGDAINGVCQDWCEQNGYSDPFRLNGEWWAFPPNGVMPVQIKTVISEDCRYLVRIGSVTVTLLPDGSLA
ncbi:MAG: hypothetical protein AAF821_19355 [Cyanobacteria bacterium P01_D01_bin.156]